MIGLFKRGPKRIPLEEQFRVLRQCGIELHPEYAPEMVVSDDDRTIFEEQPYFQLAFVMGTEIEEPPWGRYYTDDLYALDLECIEDEGAYVDIARQLSRITKGTLPLEDIEDQIDHEERSACLSFRLNGEDHRFDAEYENDWADPRLFSWMDRIAQRQGSRSRFWMIGDGGQCVLLMFKTPEECKALKKATGLSFEALNP